MISSSRHKFAFLEVFSSFDVKRRGNAATMYCCRELRALLIGPSCVISFQPQTSSVTAIEIQSLASDIFRPVNYSLALILPKDSKALPETLREALVNG